MRRRKFTASQSNEELTIESEIHKSIIAGNIKDISNAIQNNLGDINLRNPDKKTPLDLALSSCNLAASELLIENGANLNICNREGLTPLHQLVKNIDLFISQNIPGESIVELAKKIMIKGADLSSQDRRGNTLINFVAQKAKANKSTTKTYTRIGKLLLSYDKNASETILIKNNMGKTSIDYLSRNGNLILRDAIYDCRSSNNTQEHISNILAKADLSAQKQASMEEA